MNPLIMALLQQVVIPEVLTAIRAHQNATGHLPTDAEVMAALNRDADTGIAIGEAWLAAHQPVLPVLPDPARPAT